jgi:hypothetical protein
MIFVRSSPVKFMNFHYIIRAVGAYLGGLISNIETQ